MTKHGTTRNHDVISKWTTGDGIIGHGSTQTTCEKWCSVCRKWIPVVGVLGPILFKANHSHMEDETDEK